MRLTVEIMMWYCPPGHNEPARPRRLATVNPAIPPMLLTARCHARSRGHPVAQNDPICIVGADSNKIGEAAQIGGDARLI
jgi:hypothetical protein